MQTGPVGVEAAPETPGLKNCCAPDDRERIIRALEELLSFGRPMSEVLDYAKRLAASSPSELTTAADPEPAASDSALHSWDARSIGSDAEHEPNVVERLRTVLAVRAQQEDVRSFQLPRLTGRAPLWLATALCLTALSVAAGTAVLVNLPTAADATSSVLTLTSKPALRPSIRTPVPSTIEPGTSPEPSNAAQHLSAEQVTALRARGDAL
jgi:hypothetical protein